MTCFAATAKVQLPRKRRGNAVFKCNANTLYVGAYARLPPRAVPSLPVPPTLTLALALTLTLATSAPLADPAKALGPELELARYPMQNYAHHVAIAGPNTSTADDANSRACHGATGYDVG